MDANGSVYHYWGDGTIRDIPYNSSGNGNILERDYVYETNLISGNELNLAYSIPVSFGLNFYVTDYFETQLKQTVSITDTDVLDGHAAGSPYDIYMYSSISFILNPSGIGSRKRKSIDFDEIDEKKISFAIVGCGRISKNHIKAIYENSEIADLVAICDNDKKALDFLDQSIKLYYSDLDAMLGQAYLLKGKILDKQGKRMEAVINYKKCIKLNNYTNAISLANKYLDDPFEG